MSSTIAYQIALLAITLWREARGEGYAAQVGVAMSMMNRVAKPSWWGSDIEEVLTKKWQYSSMTDPADGQLTKWPKTSEPVFQNCLEIASRAVAGTLQGGFRGADSYYEDSLQGDARPKWAKEHPERFVGKLGKLNFYNMDMDVEDVPMSEVS